MSRRTRRALVVAAVAAPILLVGGAFVAAEATKSNDFCGTSCHEMQPYYRTWEASQHAEVECVGCHIPPGLWNYAKTKVFGMRELWVHLSGEVRRPIAVTRHISNEVCVGCHPTEQMGDAVMLGRWTVDFTHTGHAQVPHCIDCHARVVHEDVPGVPAERPTTMRVCFTCHDGTSQPDDCVYCHPKAPHPDRGACDECHGLRSWSGDLRHPEPLTGRHAKIQCERCHAKVTASKTGPAVACIDCHRPRHPLRLGRLNLRRCADCHVITHWRPSTFDHPRRNCVSCHENRHGSPSLSQCQQCHSQTTWSGARHPSSDCTVCHSPGPLHSGLSSACQDCHVSGVYWVPSTYRHQQVGEHIPSGEHRLACTACHKTTYASATCTPCHEGGGPADD